MNFLNRLQTCKIALALCAMGLLLLGASVPAGAQTIVPLDRDGTLYLVQQPGTTSDLNRLDRSTARYTLQAPVVTSGNPNKALNGLGYNPKDGFMYVLDVPATTTSAIGLYRIGKTGLNTVGYETLGTVSGLTAGTTYFAGDVSKDGYLYVSSSAGGASNVLYRINLNNGGPYSAVPVTITPAPATTLSTGDFAFAANGKLYALSTNGSLLYEITVSSSSNTATATQRTTTRTGLATNPVIGTLFYDGVQGPFAYDNAGRFYVVDTVNATVTSVSDADPVSRSDGTSVNDVPEYLDIVKSVGALNQINARTFEIPFNIGVKNTGSATAANVQVNDRLSDTFSSGNPAITIVSNPKVIVTSATGTTATPNPNFNGTSDTRLFAGTDNYAPGAIVRATFTVRLTYPSTAAVPSDSQRNIAYVPSVPGSTFTNNGYTYSATGLARRPDGAVASEASSPGVDFPALKANDPRTETPVNLPPIALEGRVYEDYNFGGGAGRAFNAAQGMRGAANARVEIYNSAGAFVGFTLSDADGLWSYAVSTTGTYYARVVNNSVLSTRAGSIPALVGVQTFRTNDGGAVTGEVGGRAPAVADAGAARRAPRSTLRLFSYRAARPARRRPLRRSSSPTRPIARVSISVSTSTPSSTPTTPAGQLAPVHREL